jgi:hypothetical protein
MRTSSTVTKVTKHSLAPSELEMLVLKQIQIPASAKVQVEFELSGGGYDDFGDEEPYRFAGVSVTITEEEKC